MGFGEFIKSPNTIGLWHFNGNANDDSGNGLNGSNVGSVVYSKANGKFNEGAGGFLANGAYISIADNPLLDLTTFTISTFFKLNTFGGVVYAKFQSGQNGHINYYLDTAGGSNRLRFLYSPNGAFSAVTINKTLSTNTWYNVIVTAGSGNLKVYINAELVTNVNYTGTIPTNTYPLIVGSRATDYTFSYLGGCIDELIIENRIWSAQEIQKYYTYTKGMF